ncbi:MAG: hypothetical protein BalsKO_27930 [Balneolaceae bacterium]
MNLQEAFNQLKEHKHNTSFDGLGEWLDQNTQKPKTMKNIYKVAASFILATMILIACTVPVEQEEEIGYMIKGLASINAINLKAKVSVIPELNSPQLSIHDVIYEQEETGEQSASEYSEVIMVLPEANYQAALDKKVALAGAYDFVSMEILPIEETVERTMFETALTKFDLKLKNSIPDSVVARRIDQFIHENSSVDGTSNVYTDENGVRYVELIIEGRKSEENNFQIKYGNDVNANIRLKQGIETLHQDLSGKVVVGKLDSLSINELEARELKERKRILEEQKNN